MLKVYTHLLDLSIDPTSPLGMQTLQTAEHRLQIYPKLEILEQRTFRRPSPPLRIFSTVISCARNIVVHFSDMR